MLLHWLAMSWEFQLWKLPPYFFLLESDQLRCAGTITCHGYYGAGTGTGIP